MQMKNWWCTKSFGVLKEIYVVKYLYIPLMYGYETYVLRDPDGQNIRAVETDNFCIIAEIRRTAEDCSSKKVVVMKLLEKHC